MIESRRNKWAWSKARQCAKCPTLITGLGSTGLCRPCWLGTQTEVSVTVCKMCKDNIPQREPRYQYVRVAGGGREGRHNQRHVVATVCEPCWKGKR